MFLWKSDRTGQLTVTRSYPYFVLSNTPQNHPRKLYTPVVRYVTARTQSDYPEITEQYIYVNTKSYSILRTSTNEYAD